MSGFELDAAVEREKHLATERDPGHAGPVTIEGEVTDDDAD